MSMAHVLRLMPRDVLMFRKPKPFTAGSDFHAESHFYPPPTTVAGAIAALLYSSFDEKEKGEVKSQEDVLKKFNCEVIAYGWSYKEKMLFPFPIGVLFSFKKVDGHVFPYVKDEKLAKNSKMIERVPSEFVLTEDGARSLLLGDENEVLDELKSLISSRERVDGLKYVLPLKDLIKTELRIGIALDERKRAMEGYLYNAVFLRPEKDVKLWVMIDCDDEVLNNIDKKFVRLGGRGKTVFIRKDEKKSSSKEDNRKVEIVSLITYGKYLSNGNYRSYPDWADPNESLPFSLTYMSGWSLKENRPRFLGYYVPHGATYKVKDQSKTFVFYSLDGLLIMRDVLEPVPINTYLVLKGGV